MASLDFLGNQNLPGKLKQAQAVAGTNTNVQSSAFGAYTNVVKVWADATCFICINANPTAATTVGTSNGNVSTKIPANVPDYYAVSPADKLAVITASGAANVFVEEY